MTYILTNIRPVVVWPDMSSPAQSLASVIKVPSNSCLFLAFCSFCLASLGPKSGSLRQHTNANARHSNTMNNPTRNVIMLDSKKHQYFRTLRHSSASNGESVESSTTDSIVTATAGASPANYIANAFINNVSRRHKCCQQNKSIRIPEAEAHITCLVVASNMEIVWHDN
uniref:Uncharacterized protein n=1 Tax=Glossina pallidipes TaxID=7398 RepID=A0A1B0A8U5_GLOPL